MRVCYIAERAQGLDGWGRYTVEVVRAVRERGIEPVLVTSRPEIEDELEGVEQHAFLPRPLAGPLSAPLSLRAAGRLRRVLESCDVVHGIVERYSPLIALSLPPRVPYVQTAHGSWAAVPFHSLWRRWFFQAALDRVDLLVLQSTYTRDQMVRVARLPRHVVWPAGVRALAFDGTDHARLPAWSERGLVILSVGALRIRKGHHVALEAVGRVRRSFPEVHLVLIGRVVPGEYADRLRGRARELGLADRTHFLGQVPFPELVAWYHRADVYLLLPVNLQGAFEGLGLAYLEAAATGTPSIATRDCGATEAVIDGETGFLVPQNDPAAATRALTRLLSDGDLRRKMGEAARRHARRFSWDALADRLKNAYGDLVVARTVSGQ